MPKLSKAKLRIGNDIITFPFNPTQFRQSFGIEYSQSNGALANYSIQSFSGGSTPQINFEIYLNEREGHNIKNFIERLDEARPYERATPPYNIPPPNVIFAFGWFVKKCKLVNMDVNYKAFKPNLDPLEVTINLTLAVDII